MMFTNNLFAAQQKTKRASSHETFLFACAYIFTTQHLDVFLMWRDRFDDGKSKFQAKQ